MGLQILDGTGNSFMAEVDADKRLHVKAIVESKEHVINEETGKVWTISFEGLNPAAADDVVVYIKNTGNVNLEIITVRVSVDTAISQVEIHAATGTAASGNTNVPVSRNVGSGALPSAIIEDGTDITGLTNTGILGFIQCAVVATQYELHFRSGIIIPKGAAVAITVEVATANLTGFITLAEEVVG